MGQVIISAETAFEKIKNWSEQADLLDKIYYDDFDWSDFPDLDITDEDVKEVHSYEEGDGNPCGRVFFIEKFNLYFKVSGWYSSWDSGEITDIDQVYPHSVYRIEYEGTPQTAEQLSSEFAKFTEVVKSK